MDVILEGDVVNKTIELAMDSYPAFKDKLKQVREISLTDKDGMPIDKRLRVTVGSILEKHIVNALAIGYTIDIGGEGYINVEKAKYCLNGGDLGEDYSHFFNEDEINNYLDGKDGL